MSSVEERVERVAKAVRESHRSRGLATTRWEYLPASARREWLIDARVAIEADRQHVEELVEALRLAKGHLEEMRTDVKHHPIGHCPVLDRVTAVLAKHTKA